MSERPTLDEIAGDTELLRSTYGSVTIPQLILARIDLLADLSRLGYVIVHPDDVPAVWSDYAAVALNEAFTAGRASLWDAIFGDPS